MPTHAPRTQLQTNQPGDMAIALLAFGSASGGIVLGASPLWVALVAMAWPLWAFVGFNHLAGRASVVVCLISAIAAAMGTGGASAWSAVGLLASIDVIAFASGLVADSMAPAAAQASAVAEPKLAHLAPAEPLTYPRTLRPTRRTEATRPGSVERTA